MDHCGVLARKEAILNQEDYYHAEVLKLSQQEHPNQSDLQNQMNFHNLKLINQGQKSPLVYQNVKKFQSFDVLLGVDN